MVVKAVELARRLGLSKATVSLALNNRKGVNPRTREQVLRLKAELEGTALSDNSSPEGAVIRLVLITRGYKVVVGDELDLWSYVNASYSQLARESGYRLDVTFFNLLTDVPESLERVCNAPEVAGVIVCAAELTEEDRPLMLRIRKPLVIYDADLGTDFPQVQLDNAHSVCHALAHAYAQGMRSVWYIARKLSIYNYEERRLGMGAFLAVHPEVTGTILPLGNSVSEIQTAFREHLSRETLPDTVLCESFHGTLAVLPLLRDRGVRIISVDEIPEYMRQGRAIDTVSMPHLLRVKWVMQLLSLEIAGQDEGEVRPRLIVPSRYLFQD